MKIKFFILLAVMAMLFGCSSEKKSSTHSVSDSSEIKSVDDFFPLLLAEKTIQVQVAMKSHEMSKGLMNRKELMADHGMLFLYKEPRQVSFWMRNVSFPLDVGFFDASGELLEIHRMFPHDETPINSSSDNIQFALEVNRAWFSENNIKPGVRFSLEEIVRMIQARGGKAEEYSITEVVN